MGAWHSYDRRTISRSSCCRKAHRCRPPNPGNPLRTSVSGRTTVEVNTANLRGIVRMLAAVGVFAAMDALLKLLAPHYSALQLSAMRGAASLPFMLLALLLTGRLQQLKP